MELKQVRVSCLEVVRIKQAPSRNLWAVSIIKNQKHEVQWQCKSIAIVKTINQIP